jgi:uncharacterized protein (DUF2147 family)
MPKIMNCTIVLFAVIAMQPFSQGLYAQSVLASHNSVATSAKTDKFTADGVIGVWVNEDQTVKVQIEKIGSRYHGKIIWLERPNWPDGTLKKDKYNPDPALRNVPFIGLRVVKDMEYRGNGVYGGGTIYDCESGKTYGLRLTLQDMDTALLRGYIGITLLGKTVTFVRSK